MEAVKQAGEKLKSVLSGEDRREIIPLGPGVYTIKVFNPKVDETELLDAVTARVNSLKGEGLLPKDNKAVLFRSKGGQIVEILHWQDHGCIEAAHEREKTKSTWSHLKGRADLVPVESLAESTEEVAYFQVIGPKTQETCPSPMKEETPEVVGAVSVRLPHQDRDDEVTKRAMALASTLYKKHYLTEESITCKSDGRHIVQICHWKSMGSCKAAKDEEWYKKEQSELANMSDMKYLAALPDSKERYVVLHEVGSAE